MEAVLLEVKGLKAGRSNGTTRRLAAPGRVHGPDLKLHPVNSDRV